MVPLLAYLNASLMDHYQYNILDYSMLFSQKIRKWKFGAEIAISNLKKS